MKKVCVITGGSSGIGLSIVKLFVENNYRVFNLDLSPCAEGDFRQCDVTNVSFIKSPRSLMTLLSNIP